MADSTDGRENGLDLRGTNDYPIHFPADSQLNLSPSATNDAFMSPTKRTKQSVIDEYTNKWQSTHSAKSIEDTLDLAFYHNIKSKLSKVESDDLDVTFLGTTLKTNWQIFKSMKKNILLYTLEQLKADHFCELGCGPGYLLYYLKEIGKIVYGGELIPDAIKVAKKFDLDVSKFDFYELSDYEIIKNNSVIFTAQAIEQLPDATPFLSGLRLQKDKISSVVNFEPLITDNTHQNEYLKKNDYNTNLFELLNSADDVEILSRSDSVLGIHPLNVVSKLHWKFK